MKIILSVLLVGLLYFAENVHAEITSDAWNAYLAGDFDRVAELVQRGLDDTTQADTTRSKLYFILGCSKAIQGNDASAVENFRTAFRLQPTLKHNSIELPPPVWRIFKPVQDSVQASLNRPSFSVETPKILHQFEPPKTVNDTVTIIEPKFHPQNGVLRSLIFPGWGHLYEGDSKGLRFVVSEAVLVAAFAYSLRSTYDAEDKYLAARTAAELDDSYSDYNTQYKIAWGLGITTVGLYLFAQWDYFHTPPVITITSLNSTGLQFGLLFAVN